MNSRRVELRVAGESYGEWTGVSVNLSLDQLAGSFDLQIDDRWDDRGEPFPFEEGDPCTIFIDNELVLTGHIDDLFPAYDEENYDIRVVGREVTGDLVDTSALSTAQSWKKQELLTIAKDLLRPYGISIRVDDAVAGDDLLHEVFRRVTIEDGDTVFAILDNLTAQRGLRMGTDPDGTIVLTRASTLVVEPTLRRGENILRGQRMGTYRDRFSEYHVKSQSYGDNRWHSEDAATRGLARESDAGVTRYRPLIIVTDQSTGKDVQRRAQWERQTRAGQSRRLNYEIDDWRNGNDELWRPNVRVRVDDPWMRVVGEEMLVVAATFVQRDENETCSLELVHPDALELVNAPTERNRAKGSRWSQW